MSSAGMVLSQPPSSTTPSIGLARSSSSVAIAAMLRHSIAVGRTWVSPEVLVVALVVAALSTVVPYAAEIEALRRLPAATLAS